MDVIRGISETTPSGMPATSSLDTLHTKDKESHIVEIAAAAETRWQYFRRYFTSRDGWIGNYVCGGKYALQPVFTDSCLKDYAYLVTPNIWPLNRKYKHYRAPFYGLNDEVPILLTIILGMQHALTMIGSIVSPPLAIAGGAFSMDAEKSQYLVSAAFITTGIATALQVTRVHFAKTPFYIGTGLLSVVAPTFDILAIAFSYSDMRYSNGTCPISSEGSRLPCPDAWGAMLGTILCTVWIQILLSFVPPRTLNRIFPKVVTGTLLLLVGVFLISSGMENWGGSSNCNGGSGYYALCPNIEAPRPLSW